MTVPAQDVLALHRELVAIPSLSGDEAAIADHLAAWLGRRGVATTRLGASLLAVVGNGPLLLLDTHLDTVPPAAGWSRDPFVPDGRDGRVIGLGANDAKASVAAMCAAFVELATAPPPGVALALALVAEEETRGTGTTAALAELASRGTPPATAVVGEPTGLDLAIAQKGLLVLELRAHGVACHAAHRRALGTPNAAVALARDLVAVADLALATEDPLLGPTTLEPTVVRAGETRNVVPAVATATLDVRTTPAATVAAVVAQVRGAVAAEVRVLSDRLRSRRCDPAEAIVRAAQAARPGARLYGSPTLSDMALMDCPAVKFGPGASERSHTADEFVLESEILDAAAFYAALARHWARGQAPPQVWRCLSPEVAG